MERRGYTGLEFIEGFALLAGALWLMGALLVGGMVLIGSTRAGPAPTPGDTPVADSPQTQ